MSLPSCFESLKNSIKHKSIEITVGHHSTETDNEEALKELSLGHLPLKLSFFKNEGIALIQLSVIWTILEVEIEGFDPQKTAELYQIVETGLDLKKATGDDYRRVASLPNIAALLWKIYDKTEDVSKKLSAKSTKIRPRKRCFVSFRFDDHNKALAFELKEFLELVGVSFVSGLGYEPRSISEKVLNRLAGPLDLFIVIFSSAGDSAWLHQEIGVARARKLPILVLKEESQDVDLGMLGDTEYISFPRDGISKTFVGILQALSYVEKSRDKAIAPDTLHPT